jgi:hypothetical protein
MAKKQASSQQTIPFTEAEPVTRSVESTESTAAETSTPTPTNTSLPQEILAQGDEGYYVSHWGINE